MKETQDTTGAQGDTRRRLNPVDAAGLFVRGMAMGAADIVPGVSGGTIAFITGVYERFIEALRSLSPAFLAPLAKGRVRESTRLALAMHWEVLAPLALGIGVAIVLMSRVLTDLMENRPGQMYAFFFGLILASVWAPLSRMRTRTAGHGAVALAAAVGAFLFVGMQPGGLNLEAANAPLQPDAVTYAGKLRQGSDVPAIREAAARIAGAEIQIIYFDPKGVLSHAEAPQLTSLERSITEKQELEALIEGGVSILALREKRAPLAWLFVCGVIAISAMILPGLSGAFLLLFLGQYHAVLSAIHGMSGHVFAALGRRGDALTQLAAHTWWEDTLFLGVFGVGVLLGIASFSRVVGWLFEHRHDVTMAALTGLMIGALRQPASVVLDEASRATGGGYWTAAAVAAVGGVVIVVGLSVVDSMARSRRGAAAS